MLVKQGLNQFDWIVGWCPWDGDIAAIIPIVLNRFKPV